MSDEPAVRTPSKPEASPRRPALGRGLGALLGDSRREEPLVVAGLSGDAGQSLNGAGFAMLAVASISPHPGQPRRRFDEAALDELAASIAARGVIQPVIVTAHDQGYRLVAGERRWRAAQKAQLHEIPALIRDLDEREITALALIENLQREDLNPIEEARAYHKLAEDEGLTQAEIAKLVDKSRSHVANFQRLLTLPEPVLELVEEGRLSMGHARALIGVEDALMVATDAVARHLSVREVEKLVRRKSPGSAAPRRARGQTDVGSTADIAAVQGHLEEFLGLPVRINADADPRSGTVTIRYRTLDQLDLVCQRLTGGGI
ncbi:ParB/RepB/Spo0J family partition protein [Novosphingobium sp.]|uniref:ParB/RepB/Spo0J family partition protein n=1 Tax=Novosphingobium sp. TaxID=1874826 RepID=UPI0025EE6377|nr:ParB/RepB/Spo0J family partition protein [Novosphingobium sp.]